MHADIAHAHGVAERLVIADRALVEDVNPADLLQRFDRRGLEQGAGVRFLAGIGASSVGALQIGNHRRHEAAGFAAGHRAMIEGHR
jgi:hypothetical protein